MILLNSNHSVFNFNLLGPPEQQLQEGDGATVIKIKDRLQIFVSNSYREFVASYDTDTIFYKLHTN